MTDTTQKSDPKSSTASSSAIIRIGIALVGVVALVLLGKQLTAQLPRVTAAVDGLGAWGPVVFIATYAVACVAFVPASLLTLAAGALFGVVKGTLVVLTGATLGALGAFLIARYVAQRKQHKQRRPDRYGILMKRELVQEHIAAIASSRARVGW